MKEFVCPGLKSKNDLEIICEFFGKGTHFCPYSAMTFLEERRIFPDCPYAPKVVWKAFKIFAERKEHYFREISKKERMKKGDVVKIYEQPLSETKFEGEAKLISFIRYLDASAGFELWRVKFIDDGQIVSQTINIR